jgi:hypothetical protein
LPCSESNSLCQYSVTQRGCGIVTLLSVTVWVSRHVLFRRDCCAFQTIPSRNCTFSLTAGDRLCLQNERVCTTVQGIGHMRAPPVRFRCLVRAVRGLSAPQTFDRASLKMYVSGDTVSLGASRHRATFLVCHSRQSRASETLPDNVRFTALFRCSAIPLRDIGFYHPRTAPLHNC